MKNGTLIFSSVKKENEGSYSCEASNGIGSSLKKEVSLIVHGNIIIKEVTCYT